ncbi:MAG: T9SS type A sorting domain-containing protein [Ignavibacteriales bacterium]|jgi:photosystem II stability/assembly factor-like uncharacterized protein|nr:T9SS type A sorting domain-containing protein [Ignavibacteriales bacterium]MBP7542280.1 T9SS type A sorting domain-containing protein [Ignavibacteriaceae bacterium]MBP9122749.1 T9SS type A sorting domain-containing protein [Ignavibacteriaceae bacterium]
MYRLIVVIFILTTSLLYSQIPGFAGDKLFVYMNNQVFRQAGPGPTFELINFGDTSKSVNALFFINSTTGYASRGGRIFKTTDTGNTWVEILNKNNSGMAASENTIYIFGDNNQLYRSFNGGNSFDSVTVNLPITNYSFFSFLGISKASKVYLYAPYFNPFQGAIHYLKSTDSCKTWTEITSLGEKGVSHFVNTDFGHLSTMSKVYTTTNGGDSWVMKHEEEGTLSPAGWFADPQTGYQAVYSNPRVIRTTDGGTTWSQVYKNGSNTIADIKAGGSCVVVKEEDSNLLRYSSDKGNSWITIDMATDINDSKPLEPTDFSLKGNFPNPFNNSTMIGFNLPKDGIVKMVIYDSRGSVVGPPVTIEGKSGYNSVRFEANNLSSGVYFYSLFFEGEQSYKATGKMILLK